MTELTTIIIFRQDARTGKVLREEVTFHSRKMYDGRTVSEWFLDLKRRLDVQEKEFLEQEKAGLLAVPQKSG